LNNKREKAESEKEKIMKQAQMMIERIQQECTKFMEKSIKAIEDINSEQIWRRFSTANILKDGRWGTSTENYDVLKFRAKNSVRILG